jgi:hypothetical protein
MTIYLGHLLRQTRSKTVLYLYLMCRYKQTNSTAKFRGQINHYFTIYCKTQHKWNGSSINVYFKM